MNSSYRVKLVWKYAQDPKSGLWLGVCEALKLTLQAETAEDLKADMDEAVDAFLRELIDSGDLEQFMEEHGWELVKSTPSTRDNVSFIPPIQSRQVDARDLAEALC